MFTPKSNVNHCGISPLVLVINVGLSLLSVPSQMLFIGELAAFGSYVSVGNSTWANNDLFSSTSPPTKSGSTNTSKSAVTNVSMASESGNNMVRYNKL